MKHKYRTLGMTIKSPLAYILRAIRVLTGLFGLILVPLGLPSQPIECEENRSKGERQANRGYSLFGNAIAFAVVFFLLVGILYRWLDWMVEDNPQGARSVELLFAACLMLITSAQAIFAMRQWHVMGNQLEETRRAGRQTQEIIGQMRLEQRAWLCHMKGALDPILAGQQFKCVIPLKNTGPTPATIIREHTVLFRNVDPKTPVAEIVAEFESIMARDPVQQTIVPPNGTMPMLTSKGFVITEEIVEGLATGTIQLILVTGVDYCDSTGGEHKTRSCFEYYPPTREFVGYPKHNIMT